MSLIARWLGLGTKDTTGPKPIKKDTYKIIPLKKGSYCIDVYTGYQWKPLRLILQNRPPLKWAVAYFSSKDQAERYIDKLIEKENERIFKTQQHKMWLDNNPPYIYPKED